MDNFITNRFLMTPPTIALVYGIKQSDSEAPVMLEF